MEEVPTADDIILSIVDKPKVVSKVAKWIEENPEKGEVFIETVRKSQERGIPVSHVISKCQEILGGPPGSMSTLRVAINGYIRKEEQA